MTERLWAPWRMEFIRRDRPASQGCVLCEYVGVAPSVGSLLLARRRHAYVVLNKYPYNSGHIMVVPSRHVCDPTQLPLEESQALWQLLTESIAALREATKCQGIHCGVNLGRAAGAGIEEHVHVHLVPRWDGDSNFMPVLGDARVVPEALERTREQMAPFFASLSTDSSG
ncbi:MAG: HIT family protein [Myxococcales bacterium]